MRTRITSLMTLFFVAALAVPGWAAINPNSFTATVFAGGYVFDGVEHLKSEPVGGIKLGYDFTKYFGMEADLEGLRTQAKSDYQNVMTDDKINMGALRLDALVYLLPDEDLVPYLTFGIGMTHYSSHEGDFYNYNSTFNYGIGAKYALSEHLALRGEIRHIIVIEPDFRYRDDNAPALDDNYVSNGEAIIGLTYTFGGPKQPCAAPCPPPVVEAPKPAPAPEPAPIVEAPAVKPEPAPTEMEKEIIEKGRATLDVKFETDKSYVRPQYHAELAKFAEVMKKYPELSFELAGHTDNVGTAQYNVKLSQRRVDSVRRYLVKNFNINGERIKAKGYGFSKPIASNTTPAGRQKNRRVEAVVDYTYTVKTKVQQ